MEMNKNVIIMVAGAFIVGLLFGYGILGEKKSKKLDAKQMVNSVLAEINTLEKENKNLKAKLKEDGQSQIAAENKALKADLDKSKKANQELKKVLDQSKAKLKEDGQSQIAAENKALKADLDKSKKVNQELERVLDQTKEKLNHSESKLKSNEVLMSITDDLKNEISLLEKENAELKMTLETIESLTQIEKSATPAPMQK